MNANTTMTLMYKIFVVQTKGKTTVHLRGVYFFYMNVCYIVSRYNVPNVFTLHAYQIWLTTNVVLAWANI